MDGPEALIPEEFGARRLSPASAILALLGAAVCGLVLAAVSAQEPPAAHFHHLHLNSTDPAAAIEFYTSKFDCEKARFAGAADAVWAQKSWLLFNKAAGPPPWELTSAVWHFGWGAEDMKAAYQKQLDSGTKFFTPLTDISDLARVPGFYYAYVEGPDRALIELNTAGHHRFGHLHLFSADPVAAGEWYAKHFGATLRGRQPLSREPRFFRDMQIGPSASLAMDNVNIIIYPIEYSKKAYPEHWKAGQTAVSPTRGRVVDHVAFSFENLAAALEKLRKEGVKVTGEIRTIAGTQVRSAFIEGPDRIRIELVEGHAAATRSERSGFPARAPETPNAVAAAPGSGVAAGAAWGADHVGKPLPDFVHGDECLFCHRNDIGVTWKQNRHALTIRQREDAPELDQRLKGRADLAAFAGEVRFFLGSRERVRFLKPEGYGKFAILSLGERPAWDKEKFANRCAGCHATAVDSSTRSFSAFGLDCYTCHAAVPLEHSGNTSLAWLSKKRRNDARAVTSICAQCHLRAGPLRAGSRSTGLPYPNQFVAGDNLFLDFEVDFSKADSAGLNARDRHVLRNVRDVVLHGSETTCLSCHQVHANSSRKHRFVPQPRSLRSGPRAPICLDCHNTEGPFRPVKIFTVESRLCEY